ncbi:hypothetical protein BH18ACT8_BH18ACT8_14770 [soil metagenome]
MCSSAMSSQSQPHELVKSPGAVCVPATRRARTQHARVLGEVRGSKFAGSRSLFTGSRREPLARADAFLDQNGARQEMEPWSVRVPFRASFISAR